MLALSVLLTGTLATAGCAVRGDDAPTVAPTAQGADGTDEQSQGNVPPTSGESDADAEAHLAIAELDDGGQTVTLSGYVVGIVETGGRCEFRLEPTTGDAIVKTHDAIPDRSTTSCGGVEIDATDLASGTWSATVSYTSAGSTTPVTSTPESIDIP